MSIDQAATLINNSIPEKDREEFFKYCAAMLESPYENPPVDMETFLEDDYFIGKIGKSLWPAIKDDLIEFFEGDYIEALLTGGTRSGKSFFASIGIVRLIYLLSCYRFPQDAGELARSSHIYVINLSVTGGQAVKGVYQEVSGILDKSPYFIEEFPYNKKKTSEKAFGKDVTYFPGNSKRISALGLNPFGGCLDEVTSMRVVKQSKRIMSAFKTEFDEAHELWESFYRRVKDTFTIRGKFKGRLIALGSREYPSDWMERRIDQFKDDTQTFVRIYAQPETKPARFFMPSYFYVDCGGIGVKPKMVEADNYENNGYIPNGKMLKIPDDYRKAYARDIYGALKDISGVVLRASDNSLFSDPDKVYNCFQRPETDHPLSAQRTTLRDGVQLLKSKLVDSLGRPLVNPKVARFLHVDEGKTSDSTGLVMGHAYGWTTIEKIVDGNITKEVMPIVYIDLILEIVAEKDNHVDTTAIRNLIYDLVGIGFTDLRCSFDMVGQESMYRLRENGISSTYMSVDRTIDPYMALYDAVIEGRLNGYRHEKLLQELVLYLVKLYDGTKSKIDHIPTGSKDIADSLAVVCYRCLHEGNITIAEPVRVTNKVETKDEYLKKVTRDYLEWVR